ncbi:MAG: PAS domain S-box protein, partial [Myxococcota bacterium]
MGADTRARHLVVPLRGWRGYAVAVVVTGAAAVLRGLLDPVLGGVQPFAFFYLTVGLSALWGGPRPALLATAIGGVVGAAFFLRPEASSVASIVVPCAVFLAVSGCMIGVVLHAHRAATAAAETARRLGVAEAEMRAKVALLQGLTESVLDGILIVGPDGKRLYQNRRFEDIFAFPPEVLADPADEPSIAWAASRVTDPEAFREEIHASYRRGTAVFAQVRLRDGRIYDRFGAPVVHEGVRYGWVWTFRDNTERTRVAEQLRESEDHLRRVLDQLYAFVGVMRPDGVVQDINRAPLEAAGLTAADVLGKPIWDTHWWAYAPDVQARVRDATARAKAGEVVRFDAPIRMGDRQMWIDFQIAPLTDGEGRVTHLVPSAMDVTGRREAEAALRESQERFRLLLDSTAEAIYGLDTEGRCTFVNQACVRLLGYPPEQMLGRDMHDLVHHSTPAGTAMSKQDCPIQRAFRVGEEIHLPDEVLWRKDGTPFPAEYRAHPIVQDGRIVGAVVSFLDITERRRAEESLRRATTLLAAISDATGDVIFAKDREGRLTFANPGTVALVGRPESEILGHTDAEFLQDPEAA